MTVFYSKYKIMPDNPHLETGANGNKKINTYTKNRYKKKEIAIKCFIR